MTYIKFTHFVRVYGFVFLIRGLCIATTSGYVSYRKKIGKHKQQHGANSNYTDLVISGHTMTACLLFYNIIDSNCGLVYLYVSCVMTTFSVFVNLLVGDHYVSDLIIAVTLSCLAHYSLLFKY